MVDVDVQSNLKHEIKNPNCLSIVIPKKHVDSIYEHVLSFQKNKLHTYGFNQGSTPISYIENNFRPNILEHLKDILISHFVLAFLFKSLYEQKLIIAGDPTLDNIELVPHKDANFNFNINLISLEKVENWKKINFKAPSRKNYKDIDKQVNTFIKEELDFKELCKSDIISTGDWVCFDMFLANNNQPLIKSYKDELWIKINEDEEDLELRNIFLGKKIGDKFFCQSHALQEYLTNTLGMNYNFGIIIKDILPSSYVCLEKLQKHFNLKSIKELQQKLIEIFSFRNDVSQRRETVEAVIKAILKQSMFSLPKTVVDIQKKRVLSSIQISPDYQVYKAKPDFNEKVRLIAEKQLREAIAIDSIAYQENIKILHSDIVNYINLIKKPRSKELVYFLPPELLSKGASSPISTEILKKYCLREKALNYVIATLTKV